MIPPTSIDGTDITGATIDGTDVQEITVDGQTVFSAGPDLTDVIYRWKMDEGTGTTVNDSVGSLNGSLVGGPTWVTDANSVGGAHLDFDGSNDRVDFGSVTNEPQMTAAMWINFDNLDGYFFYWSLNGSAGTGMDLHVNPELEFDLMSDTNNDVRSLSTGVWYHIGFAYFSNADVEVTVYDSDSETETTHDFSSIGDGSIDNGSRDFYLMEDAFGGSNNVDGKMDDVIVADKGLSRSRIRDFRNASPRG